MEPIVSNRRANGKQATRKPQNSLCIIIGCHRMQHATWMDAAGVARNGSGFFRRGDDLTWFWSEGFEQGQMS